MSRNPQIQRGRSSRAERQHIEATYRGEKNSRERSARSINRVRFKKRRCGMVIRRRYLRNIKRNTAIVLAGALAASVLGACGEQTGQTGGGSDAAEVQTIPETAAAETAPPNTILPASIDGPIFPSLSVAIPTTAPAPEYLYVGDQHEIVIQLQQRLMELGFMDMDEPTDYYGQVTAAGVRKFQRQNKLTQDGIAGPSTIEAIMSPDANYYAVSNGDDGDDIAIIQQRLYQLGYLATDDYVSGHFGDKTEEAVKKLQTNNNITADGKVGRQTINLIYSDEVKANMLAFGEQSELVLAAQQRLYDLGYMTSKPDGTYGSDTSVAISTFQRKNALIEDGYLGPDTRALLMSDEARPNGLGLGDEGSMVTKVQQLLAKWGYITESRITGYFGELTLNAVLAFQRRNNLDDDGMVGALTMAKLTSDSARGPEPASSGGSSSGGAVSETTAAAAAGAAVAQTTAAAQPTDAAVPSLPTSSGSVSASVANLLAIARSKLGCSYVWGAKGPNSFDCSGFVYWCLNSAGVSQSYLTSSGWRSVGKYSKVSSYYDLQPGDIIVVSGHVGIISTDGNLIDASSSNGRVIERPLGSWWASHFIVGWRIF